MLQINELRRDERGAILLVALLMGLVLAGACFHIMDIHRAIVQREHAQNVADAVAGESAYWHAQGMNLLAFVNICMACILSAFVAVRVAELLCATVAVICLFIPGAEGASVTAGRFAERAYSIERKITKPITRTLAWGTKSEHALAAAFPYIALGASVIKDQGHGFAWSSALFPTGPDNLLSHDVKPKGVAMNTFPARMGGKLPLNQGMAQRVQKRFSKFPLDALNPVGSLPVEEEDYYQLCSRASEQLASYLFLNHIPYAAEAMGWLGGNLPGLMCQPVNEAKNIIEAKIGDEAKKGADAHCKQEESDWQKSETERRDQERKGAPACDRALQWCKDAWAKFRGTYQPPPAPEWDDKRRKDCRKDKKDELTKKAREEADKVGKENQELTENIKTAKLWSLVYDDGGEETAITSPFLHVWSHHVEPEIALQPGWLRIIPSFPGQGFPGIDLHTPTVTFEPNESSAKAGYYYLCTEMNDLKLRNCFDNSLWQMRWRYKLGIDRDAGKEIGRAIGDSIRGYLGYMEGQFLSGLLGKLLAKAGKSGRVDDWNRDSKNDSVKIDPHSIWLRRLTTPMLQASSGKIHGVFWFAPNELNKLLDTDPAKPVLDFIYLR